MIVSWILDSESLLFSSILSIFLSFPILHVKVKIYVIVFYGTIKAGILKLGMHMDKELLYSC